MGVLNRTPDDALDPGVSPAPVQSTGVWENVKAAVHANFAGSGSTGSRENAAEAKLYDQLIAGLNAKGEMGADKLEVRPSGWGYKGPKDLPVNQFGIGFLPVPRPFRNPYSGTPNLGQENNPIARLYGLGDTVEKQAIWAAVDRQRAKDPTFFKDLPNEAALVALAHADRNRRLSAAQGVMDRGSTMGGIAAQVGSVAGELVSGDPELAIGGFATGAGKTIARTIIKRAITGAAENAVAGGFALPGQVVDSHNLGHDMTSSDMVESVKTQALAGAVLGGAHAAAPHVVGAVSTGIGKAANAAADVVATHAPPIIRDAIGAASIRAGTVTDRTQLREFRRLHNPYTVNDTATPDEKAAAHVIERDVEDREASPLHPIFEGQNANRLSAVAQSLNVNLPLPEMPSTAPAAIPTIPDRSSATSNRRRLVSIVEAIGHAEGTAPNPKSSAVGGGQFLKKTWLSILPRLMNTDGLNEAQLLALRSDKSLTDDAIKLYAQDNARVLRSAGMEDSPGNIYLAHFLGPGGAKRVLRASAEAKVEGLLPAEVIAANRSVLQGKSADQVIAWAHKRVGSTIDRPPARPDAVPTVPPLDSDLPVSYATFKPDQVETDAPLMQYKSGGDAAGVTDALKGVDSWNPVMSQQILVWEGKDGRRVVVDGHQRTGLAKRLFENDPSIDLPAAVVREADGVTAAKARTLGALRNIANGTGTLIDNARVLRDAPEAARMVSPSGRDAQAIVGLSRLSYEAFGAAINRVIDPELAAQIGLHGPDPATHGSMVALLHKSKVTKPSEAAIMVRQAHADGVGTAVEDQMAMFPDTPAQSLYLPIARILEASAKRLRDEKRTFKVLSTKASRIEGAGNVLDRTANQGRIVSSDEALGILNATAHSSGPVRDALIAAARAELSGTRRADAVGGFLDALAGIDLRTAAQGVERHGGAGTAFIGPGHDFAAAEAHANVPDGSGPSLFDDAISAKARVESFSDPVGSAAKEQADLLAHDIGQDVHLFGTEASTGFQMDEHGVATEAAVIMKEATADEAAAAAARACL